MTILSPSHEVTLNSVFLLLYFVILAWGQESLTDFTLSFIYKNIIKEEMTKMLGCIPTFFQIWILVTAKKYLWNGSGHDKLRLKKDRICGIRSCYDCISQHPSSYRVFFCGNSLQWDRASSFTRFADHTKRRTAVDRIPLDEWLTETSSGQHTTPTTDKNPCPRWDSNPQSQRGSGRRPTP